MYFIPKYLHFFGQNCSPVCKIATDAMCVMICTKLTFQLITFFPFRHIFMIQEVYRGLYRSSFMTNVLTCRSRKCKGETNFVNDGSVPSGVPVNRDTEPACTVPCVFNDMTYTCVRRESSDTEVWKNRNTFFAALTHVSARCSGKMKQTYLQVLYDRRGFILF